MMSFVVSKSNTIVDIVHVLDELKEESRTELLRQLKLKRATLLVQKLHSKSKSDFSLSDDEIGEMIHHYRTNNKKK